MTVFVPVVAEVVLEEQEPPKVTVPASEDENLKSGVLSFVGVVIVLPEITGGVVSVLPPPVLVSVPVDCKVIPKLRLLVFVLMEKLCDSQ